MEILRKLYVFALLAALLVLALVRPPLSGIGQLALAVTLVSLVATAGWASGTRLPGGRLWHGWLVLQLTVEPWAFVRETSAIWADVGGGWEALAVVGSGLLLAPLFVALYRSGAPRRGAAV